MFQVIIILGVLLLLIILYTLFRISRLVSVVKGSDKKVATTSNKVNGSLFMVFLFGAFGFFFWY